MQVAQVGNALIHHLSAVTELRRMMDREALEEKETVRMEAFSDGVFAFAITLLALNLRDPAGSGVSLSQGLIDEWPAFFAFVTSFLSVLIMWMNHHNMFNYIRKIDRRLMLLNGILLLFVVLTVFNTSLVADHIQQADANVAATLYRVRSSSSRSCGTVSGGTRPPGVDCSEETSPSSKRRQSRASTMSLPWPTEPLCSSLRSTGSPAWPSSWPSPVFSPSPRHLRTRRSARRILGSRTGVGEPAELRILSGVVVLESGSLET